MRAPLLSVHGLELVAGPRTLVSGLEFSVARGERWAVLGPNGAGKSTLLAVLAGVRRAEAGEVHIEGRPLRSLRVDEAARLRALVSDRWIDAFGASVLDTVLTARYVHGADAAGRALASAALELMDCSELAGHDVRSLSRGERQRVAIATALAQATPLLLMDEPTAHQDPRHQAMVLARLARYEERAFVATLHGLNAAAHFATHALLLDGAGGWIAGPAREVLTAERLSRLFGTEVKAVGSNGERVFVARWES